MDGNSRWAEAKGMAATQGHEAGVQALRGAVIAARKWGIPALTVSSQSAEICLVPFKTPMKDKNTACASNV
jgi:undecaprenyl diphosphate synthase